MTEVKFISTMEEFLEYNQIIKLLEDQMEFIGSPKTNHQIMETFKLAFGSETAKLMILHQSGHPIGFMFFNVSIGMESAGKYIWLNEMHIHKEYRGKGYGTVLFEHLKSWCRSEGIKRIIGLTDEENIRTINFYHKQGCTTYPQQVFSYHIEKQE